MRMMMMMMMSPSSIPLLIIVSSVLANTCFTLANSTRRDLSILRLCNASSPVSLEAINSVFIHRRVSHRETRRQTFKCFLLCLYAEYDWVKYGLPLISHAGRLNIRVSRYFAMDREGGSFKLNAITSALQSTIREDHRVRALIYKCSATDLVDPCDRAFHFTECFWSHDDEEKDSRGNIAGKENEDELASGFYRTYD